MVGHTFLLGFMYERKVCNYVAHPIVGETDVLCLDIVLKPARQKPVYSPSSSEVGFQWKRPRIGYKLKLQLQLYNINILVSSKIFAFLFTLARKGENRLGA